MNWLNNKLSNIQKIILRDKREVITDDSAHYQLSKQRTSQRVRQFQSRLIDLRAN
ncbi:unnamed protein product, partial [marine sediment metagenome]